MSSQEHNSIEHLCDVKNKTFWVHEGPTLQPPGPIYTSSHNTLAIALAAYMSAKNWPVKCTKRGRCICPETFLENPYPVN